MKNILIVDDDEDLLFCYQILLENEKTRIHTATKAEEALAILRKTVIDVVILDYKLPTISGTQLAQKIYEIDPDVKIFFISGYDLALDAIKKLNISVYGVFKKPVDPDLISQIALTKDYVHIDQNTETLLAHNLYSNIIPDTQTHWTNHQINTRHEPHTYK